MRLHLKEAVIPTLFIFQSFRSYRVRFWVYHRFRILIYPIKTKFLWRALREVRSPQGKCWWPWVNPIRKLPILINFSSDNIPQAGSHSPFTLFDPVRFLHMKFLRKYWRRKYGSKNLDQKLWIISYLYITSKISQKINWFFCRYISGT